MNWKQNLSPRFCGYYIFNCHLCSELQIQKMLKIPLTDFEVIIKKAEGSKKGPLSKIYKVVEESSLMTETG